MIRHLLRLQRPKPEPEVNESVEKPEIVNETTIDDVAEESEDDEPQKPRKYIRFKF